MMRVAIFGGTGFVGSYLVDALIEAGMQPALLVRRGHEHRVRQADLCHLVEGDIARAESVHELLAGADAAIYNIGILREAPARGVTFDELQYKAPRRIIDAASQLGVRRFLLMSANGVRPDGTAYQRSKYRAERHLEGSGLDWTVFRPSVIFGDPRGRMEFASQLTRDIVRSPLPAPLFYPGLLPTRAGAFRMSPVHVEDVALAMVRTLADPAWHGQTLHLGGPEELSWREILARLAQAIGRRKTMLPVPALGLAGAAALLERFESFPITRDQLHMLLEGNVCSPHDLERLGIVPRRFDTGHLAYLAASGQEGAAWHDRAA
jgi:NADH dehydrogenase